MKKPPLEDSSSDYDSVNSSYELTEQEKLSTPKIERIKLYILDKLAWIIGVPIGAVTMISLRVIQRITNILNKKK